MLHTHEADDCCGKALSKALRSGDLDAADKWTHEKCGLEWRPDTFRALSGIIKHWSPRPVFAVLKVRK